MKGGLMKRMSYVGCEGWSCRGVVELLNKTIE